MSHVIELSLFAPVPVGHRVSVVPLEILATPLFGGAGEWRSMETHLVCDENTRIIYADRSMGLHPETTYDLIRFESERVRISQSVPPIRGVVAACMALSDHGERTHLKTILRIEP
jgi:hypothetical protein